MAWTDREVNFGRPAFVVCHAWMSEAWLHLVRPVSRVACNSKQLRNGIRHGFEIYLTSTVAVALVPMNAGDQWGGK